MSTTPTLLRNASDTFVSQSTPNKSFPDRRRMYINTGGSADRVGLVYFGMPFPKGVTIISAKLRVYNDALWSGSRTLTVKQITQKWNRQRVNWNSKPTVTSTNQATLAKTSAAAQTMWEFNLQAMLQAVSNGSPWYGVQISSNASSGEKIFSAQAVESLRPVLEIAWSDAPQAPSELRPSNGLAVSVQYPTFQCDFTDVNGDTDLAAIQVQTSTVSNFASTEWDSGAISVTTPELITDATLPGYITLPAWSGVSAGATKYWRVRVQDAAGNWSAYSSIESFVRTAKSVFSLDNPASGTPFVWENTPPIIWSKTSGTPTQTKWQVIILDSDGTWAHTSGKISGSDLSYTLPKNIIKQSTTYTVVLRIWDNVARMGIANDPTYVEISRAFTLNSDATTNPVTSLAGSDAYPYPWTVLTWSRATAPDMFDIYRDGEPIDAVTAVEVSTGGTSYSWTDITSPPYVTNQYEVRAVANNKGSASNPTVNVTPRSVAPCLSLIDATMPCFFLNPETDVDMGAVEEVVDFIGDAPPILVTQTRRGFEGTMSGIFADNVVTGLTAKQMRNNFKKLKKSPGKTLRLTFLNEHIRCFIYDAKYVPIMDNDGISYQASFSFVQVDY